MGAMRAKVANGRTYTAQGVSLPPQMTKDARKRATELDVSFSKYIQRLIKLDLSRKLLSLPADGV